MYLAQEQSKIYSLYSVILRVPLILPLHGRSEVLEQMPPYLGGGEMIEVSGILQRIGA